MSEGVAEPDSAVEDSARDGVGFRNLLEIPMTSPMPSASSSELAPTAPGSSVSSGYLSL